MQMRPVIIDADALHLGDAGQAHQHRGHGQALLQRGDQRLPAAQRLRVLGASAATASAMVVGRSKSNAYIFFSPCRRRARGPGLLLSK
jgi:hypothetical protein